MNLIATIAHRTARTNAGHPSRRLRLGLALLTTALLSATACGTDSQTEAGSGATTTAPTPGPASTTATTTSVTSPTTTTVTPPTTTVTSVTRPTATIDLLVGTQGPRVHVRRVGQGSTTVLLIAGFGGDATGWAAIEPSIAARARVCSYERPGTGTSDPASATATFTTQATDLHALLGTVGEPGPYVVVGHSFGGAEAVTFASLFSDEVTGLVLIDASPTTWPAAVCAVPDDASDAAAVMRATCDTFSPTVNAEHLDVTAAFSEASRIEPLDTLPMAVITATDRTLPAGLAAAEVTRLTDAWNEGQREWMELSTAAHLVSVDHTGHHIEIDQPGVVIDEITRLLP